jgi:TetR/AcrR family transcriptional repressor of nem operon
MVAKGDGTRERLVAAAEALILRHGYAGTSLDDLLRATGLTKGAFFHHFKSKAELARAVVERYAESDYALFAEWAARADRLSDDPLERVLIFLRLFEEFLDGLEAPLAGCVFAAFTHESATMGPEIQAYIRERLGLWQQLFEDKLRALIAARPPAQPVTASGLAELIVTLIEGGLIMGNALEDRRFLQRQSRQVRTYLELLFKGAPAGGDQTSRPSASPSRSMSSPSL